MKKKDVSSSKTRKRTARRPSVKAAEKVAVPRKKVILVDGASFYHPKNRKQINLGQVNWQAFVSALKEIGTGVAEDPVYTIWPGTPDYTMKSMTAAGFKLEPIHPAGEMDDHFLIRIINDLDPKEVDARSCDLRREFRRGRTRREGTRNRGVVVGDRHSELRSRDQGGGHGGVQLRRLP